MVLTAENQNLDLDHRMSSNLLLERGLPRLTLRNVRALLDSGLIESVDLVNYCRNLAVAGETLWKLHAFSHISNRDELVEEARQSDWRRNSSTGALSILDGIPISIKANIAVTQWNLTAGSNILDNGSPIGYNADVVESMKGALFVGQTTMDEFGMGSLGHVDTINPIPFMQSRSVYEDAQDIAMAIKLPQEAVSEAAQHAMDQRTNKDMDYMPGGSSCGSAVSVAHGSSIVSIGSDTGGSVRLPAAFCNVVGLKPSYGLISRWGLVAYASSLDTIGVLAPTANCASLTLRCLLKRTGKDSTQASAETIDAVAKGLVDQIPSNLEGVRIGIPSAFSVTECPSHVTHAWESGAASLQHLGAKVETTDTITDIQHALSAYYVLVSAEASSNLMRYDGFRYGRKAATSYKESIDLSRLEQNYSATRTRGFGREVIRRILCGTAVLSSDRFHTYYESAAKLRADICQQLEQALTEFDCLLVPTSLTHAPSKTEAIDPTEMLGNDVMTVPMSLAGLPTIALPHGSPGPLFRPSLQLVAGRYQDRKLLQVASALEESPSIDFYGST